MRKLFMLFMCLCVFFCQGTCAQEFFDFENASIEELEVFLSLVDEADAILQKKKRYRTAEELCELAIPELKKHWVDERFMDDSDGYFQIVHTRVIYLYTESNDETLSEHLQKQFTNKDGSPMFAFVESTLYTDFFSSAPYYANVMIANCVAFYEDGSMEVCSKSPIEMYRGRMYVDDFDGVIREIKDMGSQYNEVCYLK